MTVNSLSYVINFSSILFQTKSHTVQFNNQYLDKGVKLHAHVIINSTKSTVSSHYDVTITY